MVVPRLRIAGISRTSEQITEPVTKFGGQPVWLEEPTWPMSRVWANRPMMFLCQVFLDPRAFPAGPGETRVAYVFVSHPGSPSDDFFDPDVCELGSGESAVFLQPGGVPPVHFRKSHTGPTVYTPEGRTFEGVPRLEFGLDPEFIPSETYLNLSKAEQDEYFSAVDGSKIGGTPNFFQGDAWPPSCEHLLFQIEAGSLPFRLDLGASPTLFAFLSGDLSEGALLGQDS